MIIFLYGRDSYRLKQNLDKIITEFKKKYQNSVGFLVFDLGQPAELEKFSDSIKTVPFLNEKRMIILKNPFSESKELVDLIKKFELGADKQTVVVFTESTSEKELVKKDKNLFSLLQSQPNISRSFELLDTKQLENWAKKEIAHEGLEIEPAALKKLISYVIGTPVATSWRSEEPNSSASWQIAQEIQKLVNFKIAGKGDRSIKNEDIEALVTPRVDPNIFELVDAVAGKNKLKAVATLHRHLGLGADSYYLFSMLLYQFRNLLRVKSLISEAVPYTNIIKKTGLNPYVVKKTYEQSKKFDLEELKHLFARFSKLELEAKSGNQDMADGLYQFIFSMSV